MPGTTPTSFIILTLPFEGGTEFHSCFAKEKTSGEAKPGYLSLSHTVLPCSNDAPLPATAWGCRSGLTCALGRWAPAASKHTSTAVSVRLTET